MTNIPLSTIDRNLRRFRENISYERRPGQEDPENLVYRIAEELLPWP